MEERCKTCRFWRSMYLKPLDEDHAGSCHRSPPVVVVMGLVHDNASTHWPVVDSSDLCGEWQPARRPTE